MEIPGLSEEDNQDREHWRNLIKGQPTNIGLPGKMALKRVLLLLVICKIKST